MMRGPPWPTKVLLSLSIGAESSLTLAQHGGRRNLEEWPFILGAAQR